MDRKFDCRGKMQMFPFKIFKLVLLFNFEMLGFFQRKQTICLKVCELLMFDCIPGFNLT